MKKNIYIPIDILLCEDYTTIRFCDTKKVGDIMSVAERMKSIINDRGVTYSFISRKTGIPVDSISRSMAGKRKLPAEELVKICLLLGVDISAFSDT